MKSLRSLVVLSLVLNACSNELDLTTTWKDIPIVYGIVSRQDTAHYLRIEKAFLDPQVNAFVLAKNPDSLYYDNALVQIVRPSRNETITLQKVDASLEGYGRDEGVFATAPNYLYKMVLPRGAELESGEKLNLVVTRGDDSSPAQATTTVLADFTFISGQPGDVINWSEYERDIRISWRPEGEAAVYDVKFYILIEESSNGINGPFLPKTLEWQVATNFIRPSGNEQRVGITVEGIAFYNFLKSSLEASSSTIRRFKSLDVEVIAGGSELLEYINIRQANTGITSSQEIPTYSNIEGGLGLFSSKNRILKTGLAITPASKDSLIDGVITRNLNFRD